MNDHHGVPPWWQHQPDWADAQRTKQIADLSELAQRAVLTPESLTTGEIQAIAGDSC